MSQPARTAEEANKAHYDEFAVNYENLPDVFRLGSQVANEFKRIVKPDPEVTRVMEYACGTGVVSREIAPSVKSILGVDISQGMVNQFNKRGNEELRAICVQQGTPLAEQLGHETFDAIVCSMAYHHFADPAAVTRSLAESLAPKGTLVIADRVKFEGAGMSTHAAVAHAAPKGPHPHGAGLEDAPDAAVPHPNGFSEEQVREFLEAGGLVDCGFDRFKAIIFGNEVEMFAAYGKKPAAGEAGAL
ncbi:S-adenosyl-L-methionine-dependent methyltransferase [Schizophyllum commune Loenen D]|nr:S-adenosyl-L-methionine-dependent methyltransferase [Schizophyllum commune Loenen D]